MSHLGRPKNTPKKSLSLVHLVDRLSTLLNKKVLFSKNCIGSETKKIIEKMDFGSVLLLENLRFNYGETSGSHSFARELANLADVYVNDAFGVSHRKHASTSVIAKFFLNNKFSGLLIDKELNALNKSIKNPKKPITAIIGGSKIQGKVNVIDSLLDKVDNLIIGGGMAYTFISSLGGNVGSSITEKESLNDAKEILKKAKQKNVEILLPVDSLNTNEFKNNLGTVTNIFDIPKGSMGLDIGPESISLFEKEILLSKNIIWNGPMGVFEFDKFAEGTNSIATTLADLSSFSEVCTIIGGGDSVAAVEKAGLAEKMSHISTGGGASLELLEGKTLPGVAALKDA